MFVKLSTYTYNRLGQIAFIISFLVMMLACHAVDGQQSKLSKADKLFKQFSFLEAARLYRKVVKKDPTIYYAKERAATCYRLLNRWEDAEYWYEQSINAPNVNPTNVFYYAQALRSNGKYEEADEYYKAYANLAPEDPRGTRLAGSMEMIPLLEMENPLYTITPISINSKFSDFGPAFYKDGIVFASNRLADSYIRRTDNWTKKPFLQIYYAEMKENGELSHPTLFKGKQPNRVYHEGPVAFNPKTEEMYLTRSNYEVLKVNKSADKTIKLKLYKLKGSDVDDWSELEDAVPFNSNEYSVGLPTFSTDGNILYFTSDMPGGYGGSDLYMCHRSGKVWGEPINLGDEVNTVGNEVFPFMSNDGELFFSSNGHIGLGGLDVYSANKVDGKWTEVYNLGAPINSNKDDFGFIIDKSENSGYFTSNRNNKSSNDDIYRFQMNDIELKVKVIDIKTKLPLETAEVSLLNYKTGKGEILLTDKDGFVTFFVSAESDYRISASKQMPNPRLKYLNKSKEVPLKGRRDLEHLSELLELEMVEKDIAIKLENIYYDYNKWFIREDAKPELDMLVTLMEDNPTMEIELSSHTDSRGADDFNGQLSAKRAKSAVDYIISQGISSRRMIAVGFGEMRLVNHCRNGVRCTDEEHQENRRTEFKILKF